MIKKIRADQLAFQQGLAESREQASRLIMAGKIALLQEDKASENTIPVPKPGHFYPEGTKLQLIGIERFVSRGAYKLLTAIEKYQINVQDFICLDAGASTGGFTDCLLQHGAKRVYAVDVGYAQLHERLKNDSRVISMEKINLRTAPSDLIPEPLDMITADLSFISLTMVLPHCLPWLKEGGIAVCLIKPQFEVGPGKTVKGVVRDEAIRDQAVQHVLSVMEQYGLTCLGVTPSAIKGPKGNQEFLAYWKKTSTRSEVKGECHEDTC